MWLRGSTHQPRRNSPHLGRDRINSRTIRSQTTWANLQEPIDLAGSSAGHQQKGMSRSVRLLVGRLIRQSRANRLTSRIEMSRADLDRKYLFRSERNPMDRMHSTVGAISLRSCNRVPYQTSRKANDAAAWRRRSHLCFASVPSRSQSYNVRRAEWSRHYARWFRHDISATQACRRGCMGT